MDERFVATIKRRDLDPLFFKEVFESCKEYKKLRGDDYHIGMCLHEMGLMEIKRIPLHNNNGSHIGTEVHFKSMFEK